MEERNSILPPNPLSHPLTPPTGAAGAAADAASTASVAWALIWIFACLLSLLHPVSNLKRGNLLCIIRVLL